MPFDFTATEPFVVQELSERISRPAPASRLLPIAKSRVTRARHQADFLDCVETAFGGLVLTGALLFAASLLRLVQLGPVIPPAMLHSAAAALYATAAIVGTAILATLLRGVFRVFKG